MTDLDHNERAEWLKVGPTARRLGVSAQTIRNLCDAGKIAHVRLTPGGDRRIPATELDRLRREAEASRETREA